MRAIILLLTLTVTAAAQSSSSVPQKTTSTAKAPDANLQQAKDIIDKSIKALGGQAYLQFKTIKQQGRGFGFDRTGASAGVGTPFTRYYFYPDKERYDFFRQGDWVIIHDGDKGYETTYHGTRAQEAEEISDYIRRRQYALDLVLREWAQDKRTGFFYEGVTIAETKQVHQVALMNAKNQGVTLFIDAKTFLPVKKSYTWRNLEMRETWEESEMYDGYRLIQGIQTPFILTGTRNGKMIGQRFYKTVEYNVTVNPALLVPPPLGPATVKK
ncbi:MAG TPA: hypothetical protein VM056_00795 [Terriglobales bacterium]|nr:hypothetical protein [Terriglobales bacterium]